ncbi:protein FATTY ACID EXPORT 3, chloroplastic-like [Impatiens glandulifera]|uniref:protein FATTY ACID EXPORT 3, chloroplastic-like n=1 Tax=Impatiens glandulifera TaxID=253017 RepID=UPI001FB14403|nr:protein FATTY ACID EXPORT 3, chloroplastic-like [Impatiens glandulifera]
MSFSLNSLLPTNPRPTPNFFTTKIHRAPMALNVSPYLRSILHPRQIQDSTASSISNRMVSFGLLPLYPKFLLRRSPFSCSAADDKSNDLNYEMEKEKDGINVGIDSQQAWKEMLDVFKGQALKIQSNSQEAYEVYTKKALIVLNETSEKMKIQAENARQDLTLIAEEISREGKEYLITSAESSPEPVKEIVDTFATSSTDVKELSNLRDFYLGIPYGFLLCFGGFLSFMITGSVSAIRFGIILGGVLLALSISSLREWRTKGVQSPLALKGQAVIATLLFLRNLRLLFEGASLFSCCSVLLSGAMAGFYLYRIRIDRGQAQGANLKYKMDE